MAEPPRGAVAWAAPAAVAAVGAATLLAWLAFGVDPSEAARFVAYEAGLVVAPGVLVWWAVRGVARPSALDLVTGWALGYAIEIAGFALAGALGVPAIQPLVQAGAALAAVAVLLRRPGTRLGGYRGPWLGSAAFAPALAAIAVLAIAYLALASFTQTPLPGSFDHASYFPDLLFQLGIAAEALHHWPVTDPKVAGEALPYHTFVDMHMAAAARFTGVGLPVILFRLYLIPLVVLIVAQLGLLGSALGGRRWIGPVAAALFIAFGELDPSPQQPWAFFNTVFFSLHTSPSFIFGLPLFLGALTVLWPLIAPGDEPSGWGARGRGGWLLLALLLGGCAGAKASILPVLGGGLLAYVGWRRIADGLWDRRAAAALGLVAAVFAISYAVLYHGETGGLELNPPGTFRAMRPTVFLDPAGPGGLGSAGLWAVALVVGAIGFIGPILAGLAAGLLGRAGGRRPAPWRVMLAALLIAGLVPAVAFSHSGNSQNFFTYYGIAAGCVLAADGLVAAGSRLAREPNRARIAVGLAGVAASTVSVVLLCAAAWNSPSEADERRLYLIVAALLIAVTALGAALAVRARRRGCSAVAALAAPVVAVLAVAALDTPLDAVPTLVERHNRGAPAYAQEAKPVTRDLLAAAGWLREHTDEDAVLAVNAHYLGEGETGPGLMYWSAFAERRLFLESWAYTIRASRVGAEQVLTGERNPFAARLRLNEAAFAADPRALADLVDRQGVDYLVVDRDDAYPAPALASLAAPLFANGQVQIYDARALRDAASDPA
ncbi:MAG: hypothetical protein QOI10_513 [Solirubrobacterales bacterium]|jgi:hypothetical protein|nr:hypothetical protein [Solirubrobacterales bacterium]